MNKEEKKYNNHTRNQRRMFRIKKQEEKINDLKLLVGNLQSQLDIANKKLEEKEEYVKLRNDELNDFNKSTINDLFNVNIEKFIKDILSIIGGE